ncbi:hypothetical protein B0H21DRAFT_759722 [Amylocystis lapponica]|nr:hypothetical protein B0H21DRAFT_759722 [Amylocystis lapponica]
MNGFLELPLELLPDILQHIIRPSHLAAICLVNKSFHFFAVSQLYKRAFIYAWHKDGKAKVVKLFRTLADHPHLASHVQQLGHHREFPKALHSADHESLFAVCLAGIVNCVNLRSCTWTRDGSLTSRVLETLLLLGRHQHAASWVSRTGLTLKYLSLVSSPLVNDALLETLAPNLANLEHLYIVGCPKVTEQGLWAVLHANYRGLLALGMEGVSPAFDMARFSQRCESSRALARLQSLTFAVNAPSVRQIPRLLTLAPLERSTSHDRGTSRAGLSDAFCAAVVDAHGARLRRFSAHRMRMSIDAIADICRRCVRLEQLFVVVEHDALNALGPCLSQAQCLRAIHVNRPLELSSEGAPAVSRDRILAIVRQCPPTITQFGYNTRVWQIERVTNIKEDGTISVDVRLSSYESPEVPEQFLVVRT